MGPAKKRSGMRFNATVLNRHFRIANFAKLVVKVSRSFTVKPEGRFLVWFHEALYRAFTCQLLHVGGSRARVGRKRAGQEDDVFNGVA